MKCASKTLLVRTGVLVARTVVVAILLANSPSMTIDSCESLRDLNLPDTTITVAERVAAGAFSLPEPYLGGPLSPGPRGGAHVVAPADLPAFCRVAGVIRPVADSEIGFELWMPLANWNHKFMGAG